MKKTVLLLVVFCLWILSLPAQKKSINQHIFKKDFFSLKKDLSRLDDLSEEQRLIYSAVLLNAFGNADSSLQMLSSVANSNNTKDDTLGYLYYKTQYDNYVKLFRYKEAYNAGTILISKYPQFYSAEDLADEKEALKIWQMVRDVPAQKIYQPGKVIVPFTKDKANLWTLPVKGFNDVYDFVFDSGAGISTVTETYADSLGVNYIPGATVSIKSGITGIPTLAKLGVAQTLHVGDIEIQNCLFLVFPDAALSFADGAYKIKGIIGFPVIKEMGTLQISENQLTVTVSKPVADSLLNLSMDELKPVVYLSYQNNLLPFTLDFGAQSTVFSDVFYNAFKTSLYINGVDTVQRVGGTSGEKVLQVMRCPLLQLKCDRAFINLRDAIISKEVLSTNADVYYGNIGQDVIEQFKTMIIDFRQSYIRFE